MLPTEAEAQTQQPVVKELTGCDQWRGLVKQYDGWDTNIVMAIMEAESHCNPTDIGDTHPINGVLAFSCGLLQVRTLPGRPNCTELQNPETNVEWAYRLYQAHGYQPWSVYNSGAYKQYLR